MTTRAPRAYVAGMPIATPDPITAATPRPPLTLARHPSRTERAAARRRIALGALAVALGTSAVAVAQARDGATLRALGVSLAASAAVVAFVALAYFVMLGIVVALEPLSRRGRVAGFMVESALHALLPFGLVTAVVAVLTGLPDGGAMHLRAVPALAACGALVGVLRWWLTGRGIPSGES